MRGNGYRSIMAENTMVLSTTINRGGNLSYKRTCWRCQKDKSTKNGYINTHVGVFKFICETCLNEKKPT